ncbi:4'-phosphopantetheinyl transferase [Basidiobolus meristosporus CBS 931.73]|uniref:holo-[acyl-carrier-protein] synthase n=1 Tax=Basidiobolus meristosporus CBS 931.73 TaxID=1314790 RepID=A0A1Y1XIU9_9FUNG|nr:4'-phosphopantetheinyl transferase [Basidiobolus meristosporus CBS 931.73]|eukprot:ORX85622.1 4'-phosphopantetheinyl transferase [Basidiobolus meristosporus CBS 931.73]
MSLVAPISSSKTEGLVARWAVNTSKWSPSEEEFEYLLRKVQPEEQQRIRKFHFKRDAKLALAGRLLQRRFVQDYFEVEWKDVVLIRTPEGRPALQTPSPILPSGAKVDFNISHHGDWVVFVAAVDYAVGVDVVQVKPPSEPLEKYFEAFTELFSDFEWKNIRAGNSTEDMLMRFFRHWSLKESFVKAIGTGLSFDLNRVEFNESQEGDWKANTNCIVKVDKTIQNNWRFEQTTLDDIHWVSVCLGRPDATSLPEENAASAPQFDILLPSQLYSPAYPSE